MRDNLLTIEDDIIAPRRKFLCQMAGLALLPLTTTDSAYAAKRGVQIHKTLAFQNLHTGEKLKLTYFEKGRYIPGALKEINHLMRDFRNNKMKRIDIALLDQLYDLKMLLNVNKPFDIISGYRSPETNALLHSQTDGVANKSLHMQGRAIDIRIERYDIRYIRNAALSMRRGGIGYYPESGFVHLDTGEFRTWGA